jgi:long-subunit fatty acid transport protein
MFSPRIIYVLFFLFCMPSFLYADFYNYRNVLPGERAALMGGAYTALSEDVAGSYYNPAGIALIKSPTLSINASIYRYQDGSMDIRQDASAYFPAYKLHHHNTSLLFLPSSFGMAIKIGDAALAFSVYQIDRFNVSTLGYVDYTSERKTAKFELDSASYLIGPTLGYRLSDAISVGLSCFYHYSSAESTFSQVLPGNESAGSLVVTKSSGITEVLGVKANITPAWKLGVMYGTETVNIDSETFNSYTNTQLSYSRAVKTDGDVRLPHRLAAGLAYEKDKSYTLSMDVIYYFKMEYSAPYEIAATANHETNKHREKAHLDFSLGGEFYLTDIILLRAGLYTNTSGATKQNGQSKVDMYGGTIGAALIAGDVTTSLGTNVMYGKSDYTMNQPSGDGNPRSKWERLFVSLVVGSTAKF